jgi:hypothetical protein
MIEYFSRPIVNYAEIKRTSAKAAGGQIQGFARLEIHFVADLSCRPQVGMFRSG